MTTSDQTTQEDQTDDQFCRDETCSGGERTAFLAFIYGHRTIITAGLTITCLVLLSWSCYRIFKFLKNRKTKKRGLTRNFQSFSVQELGHDVRVFTFPEIARATNNFSSKNIIGRGAQGEVYKGSLPGGVDVAVKKSWAMNESTAAQFCNEISNLSKIRNKHIVELHGYCLQKDASFIVYEFMPNGNLYGFIKDKKNKTPWSVRLAIVIKVARGLAHLHSEELMHRDIKGPNILLDHNQDPKIADFGISKLLSPDGETHGQVSLAKGTPGYMCPEYTQDCRYEISCDTFSFGVVLAELISGKTALFEKDGEILALWEYFKEKSMIDLASCLDEQVEPADKEILSRAASIACDCMQPTKAGRPPMHLVLEQLQDLQEPVACDNQQLTTTSENAPMLEHPV